MPPSLQDVYVSPGRFLDNDDALRQLLERAGVRATAQRLVIAHLLFGGRHRHVVASQLHLETVHHGSPISVATVYNTLGHFVQAGLLREVRLDSGQTCFDTNVDPHGHVFDSATGELEDVPLPEIPLPEGVDPDRVEGIELLIRVRR